MLSLTSGAANRWLAFTIFVCALHAANVPPPCDPDNGGITLPPGFCALVVAKDLGLARHMVVAPNGDAFVALQGSGEKGGVVGLRDTNGDGRFDMMEHFNTLSTTGVALRNGYIYLAHPFSIERYKLAAGELKPSGEVEIIVKDLPPEPEHSQKGIAFDGRGSLYVNIGAPSNACQNPDRRPKVKGQDPCPLLEKHAGIWKFDENKLNQTQADGTRLVTGLRQMLAVTWHDGYVYTVMNNRDSLDQFWPELFTARENAERPAEALYRAVAGSNFGWPYCFYDYGQRKLFLNPEYGGDGKIVGRCSEFTPPIAAFPAHWAPVDIMFYKGAQFPARYRNGAFIAFRGSWNRAPLPMAGYNVVFQPFAKDKPAGHFEVFASGFPGKPVVMSSAEAAARPDGVAEGPDGSLYITDNKKGKVWRVIYRPQH